MTVARFVAGLVLAAVTFVPLLIGSRALRRRLVPGWGGLTAWLVDLVVAFTLVVVVCEVLGTFGWLAPGAFVAGGVVTGVAAWWLAGRLPSPAPAPVPVPVSGDPELSPTRRRVEQVGLVAVLAAVVSPWVAWSVHAVDKGMTSIDTLWYHLPIAARFVQTGRTTSIQFFDTDPVTAYFPANAELVHTVGILLFGTDLVSTLVNLGWLVVALAAAWAVGQPHGRGPATLLAASLALAAPIMTSTQPGGALTDIAGLALLLMALAVLLHTGPAPRRAGQDVVVALALGLAAGSKFTFLIPGGALVLGMVVTAPKGARLRRLVLVVAAAAVSGGYWYVRNLVAVGNPLPSLGAHVGPLALPSVKGALPTANVARFLFDGAAWSDNFLPGFRHSLGPVWMVVWAMALVGMVGAVAQRQDRTRRMVGVVGLVSIVGWLLTPQYLVIMGRPAFFEVNLRYALPALTIGLVLFPVVLARFRVPVLVGLAVTVLATQLQPVAWPFDIGPRGQFFDALGRRDALRGAAVLLAWVIAGVVLFALLRRWAPTARRARVLTVAGLAVVVVASLTPLQHRYLRDRYVGHPPFAAAYEWARHVSGARIAVAGLNMQLQYPFTGPDLTNHVQYLGVEDGEGGFRGAVTCREVVQGLVDGRYDYLVLGPNIAESAWMAAQPGARLVLRRPVADRTLEVWALDRRRLDPSC